MAITIEGDRNEINYYRDIVDAARWRKLLDLVGTPLNGSHTTVKFSWDDATDTALIRWGNRTYYIPDRGSFENVIDGIDNPHACVEVSMTVSSLE